MLIKVEINDYSSKKCCFFQMNYLFFSILQFFFSYVTHRISPRNLYENSVAGVSPERVARSRRLNCIRLFECKMMLKKSLFM